MKEQKTKEVVNISFQNAKINQFFTYFNLFGFHVSNMTDLE